MTAPASAPHAGSRLLVGALVLAAFLGLVTAFGAVAQPVAVWPLLMLDLL